ncbi:hypothetical protein J5X84_11540 [Streptosporangiaceae bacterium NEAU-GS5]|nr:hypothetical protein [Streptosporangiaceae bacterium NEAU-GS5]
MHRWDTDQGHVGIADGSAMDPQVETLLAAMKRDGWVTEDPHAHVLPHLRAACEARWLLTGERLLEDGVYEVEVALAGECEGVDVHRAAIRLLSAIAEPVFFVRQSEPGVFDCVTGVVELDTPGFKSHGHLIRLIVK